MQISASEKHRFIFHANANLAVFGACEHECQKRICALQFPNSTTFDQFRQEQEAREFENATSMRYTAENRRALLGQEVGDDEGEVGVELAGAEDSEDLDDEFEGGDEGEQEYESDDDEFEPNDEQST